MNEDANFLLTEPAETTAQSAAPAPGDRGAVAGTAQEHVSLEPRDIPWQRSFLSDVALILKNGKSVTPVTVRNFLNLFWYSQRRGRWIVSLIRERLAEFNLITVPDFESTYLDAEIQFQLAPPRQAAASEMGREPIAIPDVSAIEASATLFADPTYRISKLAAANRVPTSVKPDANLTEAVTLMMASDFSQLPVKTSEREVKGMVSWSSIGTRACY
jgi:CBS domain-containing protein